MLLGDASPGSRLNKQYSNINFRNADGFSNYNAMVAGVKSRDLFHQGLLIEVNYTYSHAIDDLSSTFSEGFSHGQFNLGYLDAFNLELDKGNADFDVRHRLGVSGIWNPPYFKNTKGAVRQILDG